MNAAKQFRKAFVQEDLTRVVTNADLSKFDNSCLLITGASGFMGIWLTELVQHLVHEKGFKIKLYLLATDFSFALQQASHLYEGGYVTRIQDDVRTVHELPAEVNWIIHAAASPDLRVHNSQPLHMSRTIAQGTLGILECASRLPLLRGFLNISSGYVYGYHADAEPIAERDFEGFDASGFSTAYIEAKRYAESLCTIFRSQYRLPICNVRPFSFVGPYQPIDAPWAVNNFIANVVSNQPLRIQGDGTAIRSYMYGADMAWWLLNLLIFGEPGSSYNLGSPQGISLSQLAEKIRSLAGSQLDISKGAPLPHSKQSFFVPSVERAQGDMRLALRFDLDEALSRAILWYKQGQA